MFRDRSECVSKFLKAREAEDEESPNVKIRTVDKALVEACKGLLDVNTRISHYFYRNENANKKFAELCRRTHWQAIDESDKADRSAVLVASERERTRYLRFSSIEVFADVITSTPCEESLVSPPGTLAPPTLSGQQIASINDIGTLELPCNGQFLLCCVLAPPLAKRGVWFLAEDMRGVVFWVHAFHSPSIDVHVASLSVYVGLVVAIKNPMVTLCPDGWRRRLRCPSRDNFVPLPDTSLWVLRGTKWYEKPCTSALEWKLRGNALFESGHYNAARTAYSNALLESPGAVDLLSNRANANLKLGAWRAAAADAEAVLAVDPTHRKCAVRLAVALNGSEKYMLCAGAYVRAASIMDSASGEAAACVEAGKAAMACMKQTGGVFDWNALLAESLPRVGTYVHRSMRRGSAHPLYQPVGSWVAEQRIDAGTLLLVESALAAGPVLVRCQNDRSLLLADAAMLDVERDELKRERAVQLAGPMLGSNFLEVLCSNYLELLSFSSTDARGGVFFAAAGFDCAKEPNCAVVAIGNVFIAHTIVDVPAGAKLVCGYTNSIVRPVCQKETRGAECRCKPCATQHWQQWYAALRAEVRLLASHDQTLEWKDVRSFVLRAGKYAAEREW